MSELKIIGHRGARGLAPENTLASLRKAIEIGVDLIEFDVRVSKDNVAILHHNRRLADGSGHKLTIRRASLAELKARKPDLTTLSEALDITKGTPLYIEVKGGEPVRPIVKILKDVAPDRFQLGSKSQRTLRELHRHLPDVEKIIIEPFSGVRARYRAQQVNARTVSMYQLFLWSGFIKMFSKNYELYAYTINKPAKARKWARYGLAGVATDYPDRY